MQAVRLFPVSATEYNKEITVEHISSNEIKVSTEGAYNNIANIKIFDSNYPEPSLETWELRAFNKIDNIFEKIVHATFIWIALYLIINTVSLTISSIGF